MSKQKPIMSIASDVQLEWSLRYIEVRKAAEALLAKMRVVHEHPRYHAVWALAQLHSAPYDGPQYTDEVKALGEAIAAAKRTRTDVEATRD